MNFKKIFFFSLFMGNCSLIQTMDQNPPANSNQPTNSNNGYFSWLKLPYSDHAKESADALKLIAENGFTINAPDLPKTATVLGDAVVESSNRVGTAVALSANHLADTANKSVKELSNVATHTTDKIEACVNTLCLGTENIVTTATNTITANTKTLADTFTTNAQELNGTVKEFTHTTKDVLTNATATLTTNTKTLTDAVTANTTKLADTLTANTEILTNAFTTNAKDLNVTARLVNDTVKGFNETLKDSVIPGLVVINEDLNKSFKEMNNTAQEFIKSGGLRVKVGTDEETLGAIKESTNAVNNFANKGITINPSTVKMLMVNGIGAALAITGIIVLYKAICAEQPKSQISAPQTWMGTLKAIVTSKYLQGGALLAAGVAMVLKSDKIVAAI